MVTFALHFLSVLILPGRPADVWIRCHEMAENDDRELHAAERCDRMTIRRFVSAAFLPLT